MEKIRSWVFGFLVEIVEYVVGNEKRQVSVERICFLSCFSSPLLNLFEQSVTFYGSQFYVSFALILESCEVILSLLRVVLLQVGIPANHYSSTLLCHILPGHGHVF